MHISAKMTLVQIHYQLHDLYGLYEYEKHWFYAVNELLRLSFHGASHR
jgi:hypothetical protein